MQEIRERLKNIIQDLYGLDVNPEISPSPPNITADYSSNIALKLAKELHQSPIEIAEAIASAGDVIKADEPPATSAGDAAKAVEPRVASAGDVAEAVEPRVASAGDAAEAVEPRVASAGDVVEGGPPLSESEMGEESAAGPVQKEVPTKNSSRVDDGRTRREANSSYTFFVSAPGFINFIVTDEYLNTGIDNWSQSFRENISSDEYEGQTIICEFSDPNPFKVLHVGHLYTSIVGDSISRLFEYAGAKVIRANFGGDVGLHVAKTMYALRRKDPKDLTIDDIAKCYVEGTAAYEDDEAAKQEITKLNKEIYKINAEGLSHAPHRRVTSSKGTPQGASSDVGEETTAGPAESNNLSELYWHGRELSYDYFKDFYASIGLKFDKFYPESTVANLGLQKVKEELDKGVYQVSNGAVIFDGEKFGLHTRVFINQEGVPTYETKDVGLIFKKWSDYHFDKSVVITGNEQLEYMKVVLKSVEQYAPELVEKTTHLTHGLVKLPGNVKMSSRKGNFLKAVDVLNMVRDELKSQYDSTDEIVSLAATKYAFLRYKMGGNIIFDPHESVKMTGNSGPYLLYSAVRAKKILSKADSMDSRRESWTGDALEGPPPRSLKRRGERDNGRTRREEELKLGVTWTGDALEGGPPLSESEMGEESAAGPVQKEVPTKNSSRVENGRTRREEELDQNLILESHERSLAKKILEYRQVLKEAVSEMAPHKLANFLYELAQEFSRFYEHCPVTGSDRESSRIKLVQVYLDVMTHGLDILGINIPEEM